VRHITVGGSTIDVIMIVGCDSIDLIQYMCMIVQSKMGAEG